jgi:hypothetical protein
VAPAGAWESVSQNGFQTAEQLIMGADLDDAARTVLLTQPRAEMVKLSVHGGEATLRDQSSLAARKDLATILGDEMTIPDWVRLINKRVYFYTNDLSMRKMLAKNVERFGAQDLMILSPMRILNACGGRIEMSGQNAGAVARRKGNERLVDIFKSISLSPNGPVAELTVVDGIADLSVVVHAERHHADGRIEKLKR